MMNTRKSVFLSMVSLVLCLSMLLGTTYAWFTDSVVSGDNIIQSGTLDIDLHWTDDLNGTWHETENVDNDPIFNYDNWEPGFTQVRYLKVINAGNLAFKYALRISPNGEVGDLAEVMDVYFVKNPAQNIDTRGDIANMLPVGTLAELIADPTDVNGVLLPAGMDEPGFYSGEMILGVVIKMQETAGNAYQDSSVGESFNVELHATQYTYEEDIFGNDYDTDAQLPGFDFPATEGDSGSADITVSGGQVAENVTVSGTTVSAQVPAGVKVTDGADKLSLSVKDMDATESNIQLKDGEALKSVNVHMDGVAADNTVPMTVTMPQAAAKGLNKGNLQLYHVENGTTVAMTQVDTLAELTAHNQFYYDPATGDVTLSLATFSEIALVANVENPWDGVTYDYSWYQKGEPYAIANADQLAAFGCLVGGVNEKYERIDRVSFKEKTVTLLSDVNLGGKIFRPIGYYYTEDKNGDGNANDRYCTVYSFVGTFDGAGHTVSNFTQNTWAIKGDYDDNYYDSGMGLFGYVHRGTVKNLTVDRFSSDGEYTPTGCVAAYACGATFENIAITNCNPRVYNTGNGGIIGIGGNTSTGHEDCHLQLTNITVDNSNKISALWGSWDVACGGLIGMWRSAVDKEGEHTGSVSFNNCHVSAQIDVNNDVCANYQYYAYRYAGMIIGSVRDNVTGEDGRVYPNMTGITANNCTVNFGDWNDYYYCELVANTLASYTHDHQFSRLTQVQSVDTVNKTVTSLKGETTPIPSGRQNYVVVKLKDTNGLFIHGSSNEHAECYHFVNGVQHFHDKPDADNPNPTEIVNGVEVLKEDNQHIYLEFKQLFTGYSWGVTSRGLEKFTGIEDVGINVGEGTQEESVEKFEAKPIDDIPINNPIYVGDLFKAVENLTGDLAINGSAVQVSVSPINGSTVSATFTANTGDWTKGTLTFNGAEGYATITIQDYRFCKPTTVTVKIQEGKLAELQKFAIKLPNVDDYLYRVGNKNAVSLKYLFKDGDLAPVDADVKVELSTGTYAPNTTTWEEGTISFAGYTGLATVTISENGKSPKTLILEVIDATNFPGKDANGENVTLSGESGNMVVLQDFGLSSFTISGRNTVYGNGFTATYTGNGIYLGGSGLKNGVITVSENGVLDNLRIKAPVYPVPALYKDQLESYKQVDPQDSKKIRYPYQLSAVNASGNAVIRNCYIYGGRTNIVMNGGNVTVKDSVLECGTAANVQIYSNDSYTVTFDGVTTIQYQTKPTIDNNNATILGGAILVGSGDKDTFDIETNPTIVLKGDFKQYNWVTEDDVEAIDDYYIQQIINAAVKASAFNHTINGTTASNMGILFLNSTASENTVQNKTDLPYVFAKMSLFGKSGGVCSLQKATSEQINSDTTNANRETANPYYEPQFSYTADLGGQYDKKDSDDDELFFYREGDSDTIHILFPSGDTKVVDLLSMVNVTKYTDHALELKITCKDEADNSVPVTDNKIALTAAGDYTVTYTVTDTVFYDKEGNLITGNARAVSSETVTYTWDVILSVSLKDVSVPNAEFEFDSSKQQIFRDKDSSITQFIPFLRGLKIYDYNGQTRYLRFDGNTDFAKIAKASINNVNTTGEGQGYHIVTVELTDGGKLVIDMDVRANSGSSTHSGSIKVYENELYVVNGGTTSGKGQTWKIYSYKFVGNNGTEINSGLVTFGTAGTDCSKATKPSSNFGTTVKYTVSYNANGGNCGQSLSYATSVSTSVTLPTPMRSGYLCVGWYTAAAGGTKVGAPGDSYTPSSNITLYAQWGKPCTVTYDANGGTCGTPSAKYDGTALTLPTATRDGYWFVGWYDAASGGNKIGDAGVAYNPTGEITLYAHWQEKVEYTVTYNANGGSVSPASATYQGTALTLPTPTRTGYKFLGWYTAATGGTKIEGTTYTPSANITLYAQWQINSYTITVTTSNATVKVNGTTVANNGTVSIQYGAQVTVEVTYSQSDSRSTTIKGTDGTTYNSPFAMPAQNVTINATSSAPSCVTPDTLITLADGSQKRIDQVTYEDRLLVWDFFNGKYTTAPAALIVNHGEGQNTVIKLTFENGAVVKVVNAHAFFDMDLNEMVLIKGDNVKDYIGHSFASVSGNSYKAVKLVDIEVEETYSGSYTLVSAVHYNFVTEGMFSLTNAFHGMQVGLEMGEGMKYDTAKLKSNAEKYGLYTYDDFKDYVTFGQYLAFNGAYLKLSVEKGGCTFEGILKLIEDYLH